MSMEARLSTNQEVFEFKGLWELPSTCGLRIFDHGEKQVVVVTELYKENPGTSIAQVSASLAMQICHVYGLNYRKLIYIEHNPDMHSKLSFYDEELYHVHFDIDDFGLKNPVWERIGAEQFLKIVEYDANSRY